MKQIVYFFLFSITFGNAQVKGHHYEEGDGRKITQIELERAKALYNKMVTSDDVIEKNKLINRLLLIVNKQSYPQNFLASEENINDQKIQTWVDKNVLPKRRKKATKLLSRLVLLKNKIETENSEIIEIFKYKANLDQIQEIHKSKIER